jgi:hypothetical protein|tara:strand:- start:616 stop:771 length:156 start_codon:yes stop_codon:yes gene_type:complete
MNDCNCENIGFINNDWLCLECGEKVELEFYEMESYLNDPCNKGMEGENYHE